MLTPILAWLGNLLGGPFARAALDAYKAKLDRENSKDAIAADLAKRELDLDQRQAELNAQVLVAEQGNIVTRWVRPAWALPYIIWTWKVVVWDTVLGLGSTPELKGMVATLGITIAGAYFGGRTIEKGAAAVAGIFARKGKS